jgi:hypothetical protein
MEGWSDKRCVDCNGTGERFWPTQKEQEYSESARRVRRGKGMSREPLRGGWEITAPWQNPMR